MAKHVADKRAAPGDGRVKHFLRIEREVPKLWHRAETPPDTTQRVAAFLRIARGRTV